VGLDQGAAPCPHPPWALYRAAVESDAVNVGLFVRNYAAQAGGAARTVAARRPPPPPVATRLTSPPLP
jgi:hypothetical protein